MKYENFEQLMLLILKCYAEPKETKSEAELKLATYINTATQFDQIILAYVTKKIRSCMEDQHIIDLLADETKQYFSKSKTNPLIKRNCIQRVREVLNPDRSILKHEDYLVLSDHYNREKGFTSLLERSNADIKSFFIELYRDNANTSPAMQVLFELILTTFDLEFHNDTQFKKTTAVTDLIGNKEDVLADYFNPVDGKTLHIVDVLDGVGDFLHLKNWFSAYDKAKPGSSEVIIYYPSGVKHNKESIEKLLADLPPDHSLKKLSKDQISICCEDNINYEIQSKLFGKENFTNLEGKKSKFNMLYTISYTATRIRSQINNYGMLGLKVHMISENGQKLESELTSHIQTSNFGVGLQENGYCGAIFTNIPTNRSLKEIISQASDKLQELLFGQEHEIMSQQEKLHKLTDIDLIVGFYQQLRVTAPLERILNQKSKDKIQTQLIITGHNSIPVEIANMNTYDQDYIDIKCAKLSTKDYEDLLSIIKIKPQDLFFATGDNTVQDSFSVGKPLIYLNRVLGKSVHLDIVTRMKNDYIEELILLLNRISNNVTQTQQEYMQEIIRFVQFSLLNPPPEQTFAIPSEESLNFYNKIIAPFICKEFDLNNCMPRILADEEQHPIEPKQVERKSKNLKHM